MNDRSLNTKYTLLNAFYYMTLCVTVGYASVYLLDAGLLNTAIGVILAVSNLFSIVAQYKLAALIDKGVCSLKTLLLFGFAAIILLTLPVLLLACTPVLLSVLLVAIFSMVHLLMPFINSLTFAYELQGHVINYGLARGSGSAAYAVISLFLGYFLGQYSAAYLPYFYIGLPALALITVLTLPSPAPVRTASTQREPQISIKQFLRKYKSLRLVFAASLLLVFDHFLIANFLIHIVENVGGNSESMGGALFLQAMIELPAMLLYARIQRRFSNRSILMFASVFYSVKHTLMYLAASMSVVYLSMATQALSYALFTPACVYYVGRMVDVSDQNKGQALMAGSLSAGSMFAGLFGGMLFDRFDVPAVLLAGALISIAGTAIMIAAIRKARKAESAS